MTEVPEHLLQRAKARRAALSGGGDDAAEGAAPAAGAPAPPPAVIDAGAPAVRATAAAPAIPEATVEVPREESPTYIAAAKAVRSRVPLWVTPVLVILPFWGWLYTGAFGDHRKAEVVDPIVLGQQVYAGAGCSSCHGAQGQGGVGPPLQNADSVKTFPTEADHISWVKTGSGPFAGKLYGDPNRAGGQLGPAKGIMPAFGGQLSEAQIEAVVKYERTKL